MSPREIIEALSLLTQTELQDIQERISELAWHQPISSPTRSLLRLASVLIVIQRKEEA